VCVVLVVGLTAGVGVMGWFVAGPRSMWYVMEVILCGSHNGHLCRQYVNGVAV
jgi:hypothetical protein